MPRLLSSIKTLLCIILLAASVTVMAQENAYLKKGDDLFRNKQYSQAFDLYKDLLKQHKYSPAMLLRMAYIQEGLGHVSQSLYYLTLYYKVTKDEKVLARIDDMANNNKLEGYGVNTSARLFVFLEDHYTYIAAFLMAGIALLLAAAYLQKRKRHRYSTIVAAAAVIGVVLILHINFSTAPEEAIIANPATYIMDGPSAGAKVRVILGEGHQLEILGHKDVWARIKWGDREAWVKNSALLTVQL